MKTCFIPAAVAAAALCAALPSHAVSLDSSITNLHLEATDLNLNDNIAAEIQWKDGPATYTRMDTFVDKAYNDRQAQDSRSVQGIFTPLTSVSQYVDSRASSQVDATSLHLSTSSSSVTASVYANAWTSSTYDDPRALVVSPFTRVTISGELGAVFTNDSLCRLGASSASPCGQASVSLSIELTRDDSPYGHARYSFNQHFNTIAGSKSIHTPFVLTLDNNSNQVSYFRFNAGGGQSLSLFQAPVPEPAALASLAAGLAVLTLARRRKPAL